MVIDDEDRTGRRIDLWSSKFHSSDPNEVVEKMRVLLDKVERVIQSNEHYDIRTAMFSTKLTKIPSAGSGTTRIDIENIYKKNL